MNYIARLTLLCLLTSALLLGADASPNPAPVAAIPAGWPVTTTVPNVTPLPIAVAATDPHIRYLGRFDSSKGDPRCSWTDSTILLKFQGTDLNAQMEDSGRTYWEIEIDGQPVEKMPLSAGSHLYKIASGLAAGPHTVRLIRTTEALVGPTQIHGFQLNQGAILMPVETPIHRLEVIGASICCGALMEGTPGSKEPFNIVENGYLSFGEVTAREMDLDYRCIAWSGRKMWPDHTIAKVYDLTIPTEKDSKWDFSSWSPEAILINLSTNDFGHLPVDEAGWTGAYEKFVGMLHSHFSGAIIYCATSPMLTGEKLNLSKACLAKVVSDLNASGDSKVRYFEFEHENPKDGIGMWNHPNPKTQQIMGDKLAAQLSKDLGWPKVSP